MCEGKGESKAFRFGDFRYSRVLLSASLVFRPSPPLPKEGLVSGQQSN
jgi:hypothetical protein